MPSLFFTCPNTRQQADTGIMTDAESLRESWSMTLNVNCQHCGEMHAVSVRETYIDDAITNVSEIARPRSVAWRLSAAADKRAEIRGELQSKVIAEIIVAATRLLLRLPRSKAAQP